MPRFDVSPNTLTFWLVPNYTHSAMCGLGVIHIFGSAACKTFTASHGQATLLSIARASEHVKPPISTSSSLILANSSTMSGLSTSSKRKPYTTLDDALDRTINALKVLEDASSLIPVAGVGVAIPIIRKIVEQLRVS